MKRIFPFRTPACWTLAVLLVTGLMWTTAATNFHAALAGTSQTPPRISNPNLIADSDFAQGTGPWHFPAGQNWAIYSSSSAAVDDQYFETNAGTASEPTVYQDVAAPQQGQSYQGSIYLRSPSGAPVSVDFVIWALGGPANEVGQTLLTVSSSSWTRYSTDVDVADSGHTALRFQLYYGATGADLDLDGATLQDSGVTDAAFQHGLGTWQVDSGQNWTTYSSSSTPVGDEYLETNAGTASEPTVYQDISTIPVVGHSYQGSIYLRSPSSTTITGTVVVWALGGYQSEMSATDFTVSSPSWTPFYTDLDVADPGHDDVRFQVYFGGTADLDMAGAMVEDTGIADAAFDSSDDSGLGPWVTSSGSESNVESGSGAMSDQDWLETSTGSDSSSWIYQDIPTNAVNGDSYTGSVFLKSETGGPISVAVDVWALDGPDSNEVAQTLATVGSSWRPYSVVLNVTNPGYTDLRFEVYLDTSGQTLGVDLASLPDTQSDPPLDPGFVDGVGVYGPSSSQALSSAVAQGWPIIGETGGLGTQGAPYTAASAASPSPDQAAAVAVAGAGHPETWMSFWTVSAPSSGDTWNDDGYVAGQYVASYLASVSSTVRPSFVILDPEGYADGQSNYYPESASDWASWVSGWSSGIASVNPDLIAALYVDQYEYSTYSIADLDLPVFVAISPILNNAPTFTPGSNVDGYVAYTASCPAGPYETTMESWGGTYNTLQFGDSGDDCGP